MLKVKFDFSLKSLVSCEERDTCTARSTEFVKNVKSNLRRVVQRHDFD